MRSVSKQHNDSAQRLRFSPVSDALGGVALTPSQEILRVPEQANTDTAQAKAEAKERALAKAREVAKTLRRKRGWGWWLFILLLLGSAGGGVWWFYFKTPTEQAIFWDTATIDRGEVVLTVSATGNLQPQATISLGTEISGRVSVVEVDVNDVVIKNQSLAKLDTIDLQNALQQAEISLKVARADTQLAQASLDDARLKESRAQSLANGGAAAASDLESAKTERRRATAQLSKARAQEELAQVRVDLARTNINKADILAPIAGVILKRNVEPGNTISASLQAPELFILAEDLTRMELQVAVDEADVGLVRAEQSATFTVDAWPDRTFPATVASVNLAANATENVVTYTAILNVDNSEGLLRPGMTATATITTERRQNVLRAPASALRFTPRQTAKQTSLTLVQAPRRPGGGGGGGNRGGGGGSAVWVLREGASKPERVPLKIGRSDGKFTEILGGDIKEGDTIVIAQYDSAEEAQKNTRKKDRDKDKPDNADKLDQKEPKDKDKNPNKEPTDKNPPETKPSDLPKTPDPILAPPAPAPAPEPETPTPTPAPAPTPTPAPTPAKAPAKAPPKTPAKAPEAKKPAAPDPLKKPPAAATPQPQKTTGGAR